MITAFIVGKRPFYTNGQHFDYQIAIGHPNPEVSCVVVFLELVKRTESD